MSGWGSDVHGTLQLLFPDHVRERDEALLRSVMVGGVWNGFRLEKVKGQLGARTVMVIFFRNVLFHQWRFVNTLSFMISWSWISSLGLGVSFGMVGYLFFLG